VTEVSPNIDQWEACIGALGPRLADLNYGIDDPSQCSVPLSFWKSLERSEFAREIGSIINKVGHRSLLP
jgi:hypothetical protein